MDPYFSSSSEASSTCSIGRPPHPIDSLSIGDSLLQLLGSSAAGGRSSGSASTEDTSPVSSDAGTTAVSASPARDAQLGRVRFNHQVRVVLVPSRKELDHLKGDMWWGEEDYMQFR